MKEKCWLCEKFGEERYYGFYPEIFNLQKDLWNGSFSFGWLVVYKIGTLHHTFQCVKELQPGFPRRTVVHTWGTWLNASKPTHASAVRQKALGEIKVFLVCSRSGSVPFFSHYYYINLHIIKITVRRKWKGYSKRWNKLNKPKIIEKKRKKEEYSQPADYLSSYSFVLKLHILF